jgi:hypothetical protein
MLNITVGSIIVLFRGQVIFKQYIPKKHKQFGINLYKLCGSKGNTYNNTVYLGKDRKHSTPYTTTHATVKGLVARIEHVEHKLYMNSFFLNPTLFDDLHAATIKNRKGVPKNWT